MAQELARVRRDDKSVTIARKQYYRVFLASVEDLLNDTELRWRVAQVTPDGKEIPGTTICRCRLESQAMHIAESLAYTAASIALAKPLVLDTLEL